MPWVQNKRFFGNPLEIEMATRVMALDAEAQIYSAVLVNDTVA